jgi:hypothetical protein
MKRTSFRKRVMIFPTPIVRPIFDRPSNLAHSSSASEERRPPARRIFVIKQGQPLPGANGPGRKIRQVLIFDDHPDSLRLVFGRQAGGQRELAKSEHKSLWQFLLVATPTFVLVVGMFWPLILK